MNFHVRSRRVVFLGQNTDAYGAHVRQETKRKIARGAK
jgi:hypothetical protein